MRRGYTLALFLALGPAVPAPAAEVVRLTVEEAVARALEASPRLARLRFGRHARIITEGRSASSRASAAA